MKEFILFLLIMAWLIAEVVSAELHIKEEKEGKKND